MIRLIISYEYDNNINNSRFASSVVILCWPEKSISIQKSDKLHSAPIYHGFFTCYLLINSILAFHFDMASF